MAAGGLLRSFGVMPTTHDANPWRPLVLETHGLTKRFGERVVVEGVQKVKPGVVVNPKPAAEPVTTATPAVPGK